MSEIRGRLLAAAARCIGAKGLARTTSRDIAGEAGVNLAAITYHFGSKEQLVTEALLSELRLRLAPTFAVLRSGGDQSGRMLLALNTLIDSLQQHSRRTPLFLEAIIGAPDMEPLRVGVSDLWAELHQLLATHMSEVQQAGEFGPGLDPETMASLLVAVASGVVLQQSMDTEGPSIEAMVSHLNDLLPPERRLHVDMEEPDKEPPDSGTG